MYVINCDASIEPLNPGGILAWAYVVKLNREIIHKEVQIYDKGHNDLTNNIGEYLAVLGAMHWLITLPEKDHLPVLLQSDSQLVINQVSGKWGCRNHKLVPYYSLIKKGEQHYTKSIKFNWIPREKNKEADALSRSLYTEEMLQEMRDRQLEITFGDDDLPF
jgi:ribonuclease HI